MEGSRYSPLSGDVTQAINPWAWFTRVVGTQLGFINIRQVTSADPELEQRIVENVAGYGRQLGRITDALQAVLAATDRSQLSASQRCSVEAFEAMADEIETAKARWRGGPPAPDTLDAAVEALQLLRRTDPERFAAEAARLRAVLDAGEAGADSRLTAVKEEG